MDERALLHMWYQSGGVFVPHNQLETALQILRDQAHEKSFAIVSVMSGWQITKMF